MFRLWQTVQPTKDRHRGWHKIVLPISLFVLAVAVFANSIGHDFVWDDTVTIRDNPFLLERGAWWRCFGRDFGLEITRTPAGYYRPFVFLSFLLNHAIGGLRPLVYHLSNIALHGINTLLVFYLIARLMCPRTGGLAATVFAVHPVHAESVAFIAGRSDLLCACFLLLAVLATARSFETRRSRRTIWSGASLLAYAAALLSKETAVALPGVLIAYGLLHRYRLRTLFRLCVPTTAVALIYLAFRFRFFPMAGFHRAVVMSQAALVERLARLCFLYAAQQVFPVVPTLGAEILTRRPWTDATAVVLLILLIAVARPRRQSAEAIAWMVGFLAPVLWVNLFTRVDLNDRFAYVPSIGICALAGVAATRYWESLRPSRLVAVVVVVAFAALSFAYSRIWRDAITLWNASITYHPRCGRCYYNLGNAFWQAGKRTEAVWTLRAATRLLPDEERRSWAYANMAQILSEAGEDRLAIEMCRRSLELRPGQIGVRRHLADLLSDQGRHEEAIVELEIAQKFAPHNSEIPLDQARECLATQPPQPDRARQAYQRARELGAPRDENIEKALESAAAAR